MNPIIFLSIDGVISTNDGIDDAIKTKGETHDKQGFVYFCPKACEHVSKLIEHYKADVVIYSPWSDDFKTVADFNKFLKQRSINWPVIDKTSGLITKWFTKNGTPEKFVIITSDDTLLDLFPNNIALTEDIHGFADRKIYRKAMNTLKKPAEVIKVKTNEKEQKLF